MGSMSNLAVTLCGIELDNPVIPASGTFGFGYEFAELWDINQLGTFSFKGTTAEPRFGNPTPRIAETPSGMLNAVGLQNPGVDRVISEELPKLAAVYTKPVMANVSGFSYEEFAHVCAALDPIEQIGWFEVNVSCPNVHAGGENFASHPHTAAAVVEAARAATSKPLIIKLSPNVTNVVEIAHACEQAGADAFSLINTLVGMRIDPRTRRPIIANTTGGLSGSAVFPVALRMVYQLYQATALPIIGIGGVASARDVLEMMMAGATAVQVGTANLIDPWACPKIIDALAPTVREYGFERISDAIGAAHAPAH
ncbi:MAG: dihydroorotate dehydrogenase [Actinomycetaceae bacterium]|nr:dihydroorotate dehydrogenase [Arcanobacterium sp.]MDD7504561.1 dihydroorotate dehydrogenase [Actinomycetaceae bacterium]MDY6143204.1 dihydroorotate dehydrogenase [Arcanobacterium sp.]